MNARIKILICAVFVAGCGGQSSSPEANKNLIMHRLQAGEAEADGWYTAKSSDGGFTVHLPAKFNDFSMRLDGPAADKLGHAVGGNFMPGKIKFAAVRAPLVKPFKDADEFFADGLSQFEKGGNLKSKRRHEVLGYPAMDVHLVQGASEAFSRTLFLKDGNLLLIVDQQGDGKINPADVEKFFNSLTIETPVLYPN